MLFQKLSIFALNLTDRKHALILGDIAVSAKTVRKLLATDDDSDSMLWRAFPDMTVDLWNETFVNGQYIIAVEFASDLDDKIKSLLPKVCNN